MMFCYVLRCCAAVALSVLHQAYYSVFPWPTKIQVGYFYLDSKKIHYLLSIYCYMQSTYPIICVSTLPHILAVFG